MLRPYSVVALAGTFLVSAFLSSARASWQLDGLPVAPHPGGSAQSYPGPLVEDGVGGAFSVWADDRDGDQDIYAMRIGSDGLPVWSANGVAICDTTGDQEVPAQVSDGAGGFIVAWADNRGVDRDIYVQRVDSSGAVQWTANGVALCLATGSQYNVKISSDGIGGAVVLWSDYRGGTQDIYAQRVDANGTPLWTADGVAVCTAAGNQYSLSVAWDVDGAIVSWIDERGFDADVYAQRIDDSGSTRWTVDGVLICGAVDNQFDAALTFDGSDGAIIAWRDYRSGNANIYAQRVDTSGVVSWAADGVAICTASGTQQFPDVTSDGAGGAIIGWTDDRLGSTRTMVYVQRVDTSGTALWTNNGVAVSSTSQDMVSFDLATDGSSGAIVAFHQLNSIYAQRLSDVGVRLWGSTGNPVSDGTSGHKTPYVVPTSSGGVFVGWTQFDGSVPFDLWAQRLDASGSPQWISGGVAYCTDYGHQYQPAIAADGVGGAITVWRDTREEYSNIYAQRTDASGNPLWTNDGVPVARAQSEQSSPVVIGDGAGGAFVAWRGYVSGGYADIYCQHLDGSGGASWGPAGLLVCGEAGEQSDPVLVSDGAGGVIVVWHDVRFGFGNDDIYAQRVNGAGVAQWTAGGVVVCDAVQDQLEPRVTTDGAGGAVVAWRDYRNGSDDVYAQRINGAGTAQWTAQGVAVSTAAGNQTSPEIVADGAGGAFIVWSDGRSGTIKMYGQRLDSSGAAQWTADGAMMVGGAGTQYKHRLIAGGGGDLIAVWRDDRLGTNDIFVQLFSSAGSESWTPGGVLACGAAGSQDYPAIASDGAGGAILTWTDDRTAGDDVFAQAIDAAGNLQYATDGVAISQATNLQYYPAIAGDGAGNAIIAWEDRRLAPGSAQIYADRLEASPSSVYPSSIDFGTLSVGLQKDTTFTIRNDGASSFGGDVTETCDHFSIVSGGGPFTLLPAESLLVTLRFEPLASGSHVCTVSSGYEFSADVQLSGTAVDCIVEPTDIDLGTVFIGSVKDTSFTIYNQALVSLSGTVGEACSPYSILSGAGPYTLDPGDSLVVEVRFQPVAGGTEVCTIETGDALCTDVTLTGSGAPGPQCTITPTSIDFGRVPVGGSVDTSFTILNEGAGNVTGNISETCSHFSILSGGGPFTLGGPGGILQVDVRFAPGNPGVHRCSIDLGALLCSRLAYVADASSGLVVLDASDPANPTPVGSFATTDASDIVVQQPYAYIADGAGGLQIVSVVDPSAPLLMGSVDTPLNALGVAVVGYYVFVADADSGLQVIDAYDPTAPTVISDFATPDQALAVDVSWPYAFLALDQAGLYVVNVGAPMTPVFAGSADTPGHTLDVLVGMPVAYLADGDQGYASYDVSNPAAPAPVGGLALPSQALAIAVAGSYAYVAADSAGLQIVDLSNPASPVLVGSCDTPGSAQGVWVEGGLSGELAFVADGGAGVQVIDVSDPVSPSLLGTYDTPGGARALGVKSGGDVSLVGLSLYENAVIDAVNDVPDDQGGQVRVHMTRSIYDFADETELPIASYTLLRRVDNVALLASLDGPAPGSEEPVRPSREPTGTDDPFAAWKVVEHDGRRFISSPLASSTGTLPPGTWEIVQSFGAFQQQNYSIFTSTLADSSSSGTPYSVFVVLAHTTTPSVWFASPPDSGYSVDNVAPGVPQGFAVAYNTGGGNSLSWDPAPEPDFQYFNVYRGTDPEFAPGPGSLVDATATTGWTDPDHDGGGVFYKVTAVDDSGNESDPASPGTTTAVGGPTVPEAFALYQNVPNPFNPATTIGYDVPTGGGRVVLSIYDVSGRLVRKLVDSKATPGTQRVVWDGTNEKGRRVATGVYFYRMTAPGFSVTRKMILLK